MEDNLSQKGMTPAGISFGCLDLQGSMRVHHPAQHSHNIHQHHHSNLRQGSCARPYIRENFLLTMGTMQNSDQVISMTNYNKMERGKSSVSDVDESSFTEECVDGHNDGTKGKKGSPWQRVKWTDKMVRLLITAVSYIGEDATGDCGGGMSRKFAVLQKKGKWKSVSKVMAERGYHVSPQQCEDKFNDLNKRYKKLNDMLGRGTSCQVVENPTLLDVINYLTEKEKDDVRKILSSKHLFYEEMCSYHNGNRLHLPHDLQLQRSLQLALKSRDNNDYAWRYQNEDLDDDDHDMETNDHDELEENHASHEDNRVICGASGISTKRSRKSQVLEDTCFQNFLNSQHCHNNSFSYPSFAQANANRALLDYSRDAWMQKQWIESRTLQLEEQKLQIQLELLELEKQRFKWHRFSTRRDREVEKMRMENERMKLENERMALELKRKELSAD
ncbi:U6 snRNA-associated Sm-like protein LSm3-like [Hibiscus syriacus]|uniref:U6 snRNA-associated Sm-like protein LSm3-like n=1 Tax=Hibiscus syriacus TaxID=106335 RepID=A0A6A2ZT75_HIBSY|nr:uncharacterized protein LOC120139854 [Hibiscus syriacus]KAE8694736.1 U6 snRNA-associated Sm-like protein LSm3-like [Hibiscus syriacus]